MNKPERRRRPSLLARAPTVSPDDDLSDALTLMAQYQVRRLAVTAEDDRLVGVVSQSDVALQGKARAAGPANLPFAGRELPIREESVWSRNVPAV